jgi:hypothetical protein
MSSATPTLAIVGWDQLLLRCFPCSIGNWLYPDVKELRLPTSLAVDAAPKQKTTNSLFRALMSSHFEHCI